jgi:hypothetical protein
MNGANKRRYLHCHVAHCQHLILTIGTHNVKPTLWKVVTHFKLLCKRPLQSKRNKKKFFVVAQRKDADDGS